MLLTLFPSQARNDSDWAMIGKVWIEVLTDVPDTILQTVTAEYVRSGATFAPAPGMLRARAIELAGVNSKDVAANAWFEIADSRYGRDPIKDSLVIEVVRLLGGFERIGNTPTEQVHFVHDRFVELYSERRERMQALGELGAGTIFKQLESK